MAPALLLLACVKTVYQSGGWRRHFTDHLAFCRNVKSDRSMTAEEKETRWAVACFQASLTHHSLPLPFSHTQPSPIADFDEQHDPFCCLHMIGS